MAESEPSLILRLRYCVGDAEYQILVVEIMVQR